MMNENGNVDLIIFPKSSLSREILLPSLRLWTFSLSRALARSSFLHKQSTFLVLHE